MDAFTIIGWPDHDNRLPSASNWKYSIFNFSLEKVIETLANPFTYIQFQFAHVFGVGICLDNWNFFAAGLLDYRWVWSVDFLYIRLLAGVQEGVWVAADHYVDQWAIFGNLLVDKKARMTQCDDDIDAVLLQDFRLFTANVNWSNVMGFSASWIDEIRNTYLMPTTSSLNSKSFGCATNFVSGVR